MTKGTPERTFVLAWNHGGITSLKLREDAHDTETIWQGETLGDVVVRYRVEGENWREVPAFASGDIRRRGAWFYDGEIELGYVGALRTAATIVVDDPLFGLFAYGGLLTEGIEGLEVIPSDGLRKRFHVVRGKQRLQRALSSEPGG